MKIFKRTIFITIAALVGVGGLFGTIMGYGDLQLFVQLPLLLVAAIMNGVLMVAVVDYSFYLFYEHADSYVASLQQRQQVTLAVVVVLVALVFAVAVMFVFGLVLPFVVNDAKYGIAVSLVLGLASMSILPALTVRLRALWWNAPRQDGGGI